MGIATLLLVAVLAAAEERPYATNSLSVGENVVLAGELELDALREAHPERLVVVDLRTEAEGTAAEALGASELGIDYHNIPVAGATIDPAQVDALSSILEGAASDTTVVVHCATGNRAGMLWSAVELEAGRSLEIVLQQASAIMTREPVVDAVRNYAATLDDDAH